MGWLTNLRAGASTRGPDDDFWYTPVAGYVGHAGVTLTPELAMTISAFWAGVTFLARNLATLGCYVHENLSAGGKQRARSHPLYRLLRWQPNQRQTAVEFMELLVGHLVLRGNAFAQIVRGPRGVEQLVPRHPDRVRVELLPSGRKRFTCVNASGDDAHVLLHDQMVHVCGLSADGITGLSRIQYGAQSLGMAAAAESFSARFFSQGATPSIAAVHPKTLGDQGLKNMRESITAYSTGLRNAHGVLVLEEGMALHQLGIKPEDAQLLATRQHTTREVARWLGLPPHVLADAGKAPTYASIEAFGQQLVTHAFRPLAVRIEQALTRALIVDPEQYFVEFLLDALMRGDSQARGEFYRLGIQWGWFTRAEAREKENLNPIAGLERPLLPVHMGPADGGRRANADRWTEFMAGDEARPAEQGG